MQGVRDGYYDNYMGDYPPSRLQIWVESSNYITQRVLDKLDPVHTMFSIEEEYSNIKQTKKQEEAEDVYIDIDIEESGE